MITGEDVLAAAAREVGYHQRDDGHNKFGAWFGMDKQPWCVMFAAAWCYAEAGIIGDVVGRRFDEGGLYSCSQTLNWYKAHDPDCITKNPIPGSLVIFDWPGTQYATDHMGLYVSSTRSTITTIDGNTGAGSDADGWVQQKTRMLSYANPIYITPRELTEGKDVDRYNAIQEVSDACPWATETVAKLIEHGTIRGGGVKDSQGRPADMNLSEDMLRVLVWNDREGLYK